MRLAAGPAGGAEALPQRVHLDICPAGAASAYSYASECTLHVYAGLGFSQSVLTTMSA